MKILGALFFVAFGVVAIGLGLLFLVGAAGRPTRLVIGALGLALGGILTGLGARLWRRAQAESPARIGAEIMGLAGKKNGEVSTDDLRALLGERFTLAPPVLAQLCTAGICRQAEAGGVVFYRFPELQPRLAVRRCEFCEAELPLGEELAVCPQCGGQIKTKVARRGVSGEDFVSLDE